METNPEIELAQEFITYTNKNIFLTGKAGTGKTTFLRQLKHTVAKRMAIVAPTGVAAINAEGVTIHSLFQLPFGPIVPGQKHTSTQRRFNRKKINLIKSLDLLVIDEISMVRADVLDAIDAVLRRYKNYAKPFGGVQVLMIGDLHQLPPVVNSQEWQLLSQYYATPYFFGSIALQQSDPITIQLKHIYRQADDIFIGLLNKVRHNKMDVDVLEKLNSRFQPDFQPSDDDGFITLTSHNNTAQSTNRIALEKLLGKTYNFKAEIKGEFPEHAFPTNNDLELKVGAQVMFVKNDTSEEKRFYNGRIGRIEKINGGKIEVLCKGDKQPIVVEPMLWENRKFNLNEATKEVAEEIIGGFKQYPLKLAWAITIHKSQGLTFEKVIIDAQDAFAHGQVYVALSRCKTFEGIVLKSKIGQTSVKTDSVVQGYTTKAEQNEPTKVHLEKAKKNYQESVLRDLFQMQQLRRRLNMAHQIIGLNEKTLFGSIVADFETLKAGVEKTIIQVGPKFSGELERSFLSEVLPEDDEGLIERLKKAGSYFAAEMSKYIALLDEINVITDNKDAAKNVKEKKADLAKEMAIFLTGCALCVKGFSASEMSEKMANIDIDETPVTSSAKKKIALPKDVEHPELYRALVEWRKNQAEENGYPAYRVLSTKAILEMVHTLPTTGQSLLQINGIGKTKLNQFGKAILAIISNYCKEKGLGQTDLIDQIPEEIETTKKEKRDTKLMSFELFKSGKNVIQIAQERSLTESTIEGHLSHFVEIGELEVTEILDKHTLETIVSEVTKHKTEGITALKKRLKDVHSYSTLKLVMAHLKSENT